MPHNAAIMQGLIVPDRGTLTLILRANITTTKTPQMPLKQIDR